MVGQSELVALPFEESWATHERQTAVAVYSLTFLQAIFGSGAAALQSLQQMVETRWTPLGEATEGANTEKSACDLAVEGGMPGQCTTPDAPAPADFACR